MADNKRAEMPLPAKVEAASLGQESTATKPAENPADDGEVEDGDISAEVQREADREKYLWFRCECDPAQYNGQTHYWLHTVTNESRWDEPGEPYWIWNAITQDADKVGLQQPTNNLQGQAAVADAAEPVEEEVLERYNPRIHGNYDPTKPYAKYHERLREKERAAQGIVPDAPGITAAEHSVAMAAFNRATGAFQSADRNSERHSDHAKSHRQLNAFFDVDAAANAHNGRSLKEERRNQVHSKKQIQKFNAKKAEKKRKKQMAFLLS